MRTLVAQQKSLRTTERRLNAAYALGMAILVGIGFLTQENMEGVVTASRESIQAAEAVSEMRTVLSLLKDAETGQSGFILTGRKQFLQPYLYAVEQIPDRYDSLFQLLEAQPDQLKRIRRLKELTTLELAELGTTLDQRKAGGFDPVMELILADQGKAYMDQLRDLAKEIRTIQDARILELNRTSEETLRRSTLINTLSGGFATLLVFLAFWLLARNQKRRQKAEESLHLANFELRTQRRQLSDMVTAQYELATAGLDSEKIMNLIVSHAGRLVEADGAVIEAIDGDELVYHVASGALSNQLGLRLSSHTSLSGRCVREDRILVCVDTELDSRVNSETSRRIGVRSMIVCPLKHRNRTIGVLKTYSAEPGRFSEEHGNSLKLVAGILASALGQAGEFEEKRVAISALQETERQLIRATRAKSEFLANMSHEIRTPLNGIMGMTGVLLGMGLGPDQADVVNTIERCGESLLVIINDILDLSKIEAGRIELEETDFGIVGAIEDVCKTFRYAAQSKGLILATELGPDLPATAKGDPGKLRQVLTNILGNAIKFTGQGSVTLRAASLGSANGRRCIRFEVEDTGIGIPASAIPSLFTPFTQADASTTRRFGGTGLGLSISRRLVELMDGEIGVESVECRGSKFWFTLQLREGRAEPAAASRSGAMAGATSPAWKGTRVLIAEDNAVNRKVALRQLEMMGIRADAVGNGIEAIEALACAPYDLVLMDCQMPELDGYAATQRIRASENSAIRGIPIIAMTANAIKGDRERCLSAGMSDYIAKPIQLGGLRAVLERWLPAAESRSEARAAS